MTIRGYELRTTELAHRDTPGSIFRSLEQVDFLASSETRLFTCFRFVDVESDWGTAWRKHQREDCIALDLVFLNHVDLPFYGSSLATLPAGLQRLVIGLTTRDVFAEVVTRCATKFKAWGHDPAQIQERLTFWFENEGYTRIWKLFDLFERDASLSDCEGVIPWLEFDDIVLMYERWITLHGADFATTLDSRFYYERIGSSPRNRKKRGPLIHKEGVDD